MKRVFIVCLCLSFLSLFTISAFADERILPSDSPSLRISSGVNYSSLTFYRSVVYSHPSSSLVVNSSGSFIYNGRSYSFDTVVINSVSTYSLLKVVTGSSDTVLISAEGVVSSSWDGILNFDSPTEFDSSFVSWYNSFPNGMNGNVSDGVSSFIGWTGSVLSNLVMSPAVIVLVCLSIAMLAVLPWGISKLKSLIKGY